MLDITTPKLINETRSEIHPIVISGPALARRPRKATPSQRAVLADDLRSGRLELDGLTERQARLLTGASYGYAHRARHLTESERDQVRRGLRRLGRPRQDTSEATAQASVERLITRYGVGPLWNVFDRITSPQFVAAE